MPSRPQLGRDSLANGDVLLEDRKHQGSQASSLYLGRIARSRAIVEVRIRKFPKELVVCELEADIGTVERGGFSAILIFWTSAFASESMAGDVVPRFLRTMLTVIASPNSKPPNSRTSLKYCSAVRTSVMLLAGAAAAPLRSYFLSQIRGIE